MSNLFFFNVISKFRNGTIHREKSNNTKIEYRDNLPKYNFTEVLKHTIFPESHNTNSLKFRDSCMFLTFQ